MTLRILICLLAALVVCSAMRDDRRPGRRHPFPHGRRPGSSPLRRFIRKSTHDSLDLDILVTPGLDPCHLNDSKIVAKAVGKEDEVIGELTDSMVFGLRGFDGFRQKFNIKKRLVLTTLAFELLEGAGKVTLKDKKQFQLNVVAEMLLVIKSKLHFDDHHVAFSDSILRKSVKPTVRLFPSKPIHPRLLKRIGRSFIIQAEHCVQKKFVPAFEAGVNRALVAKNITHVIEDLRKDTSIIHEFFFNATKAASKKVVKYMLKLKLPNIELHKMVRKTHFNLTEGRVIDMSRPKLYFYNADDQKDTYNLQLIIRKLIISYAMNERSLPYEFSNVQFFLQVKQESKSSKLQVLKGVVIGVEIPPPPRSLPLLLEINSKLYALLMNFLEPQLKIAFMTALKM